MNVPELQYIKCVARHMNTERKLGYDESLIEERIPLLAHRLESIYGPLEDPRNIPNGPVFEHFLGEIMAGPQ